MERHIFAICGPRHTGKQALVQRLAQHHGFEVLVASTTRPPRFDEKNGIAYRFIHEAKFAGISGRGGLLNEMEINGYRYGLPISEIDRVLARGKPCVTSCSPSAATRLYAMARDLQANVHRVWLGNPIETLLQRANPKSSSSAMVVQAASECLLAEIETINRDKDGRSFEIEARKFDHSHLDWLCTQICKRAKKPTKGSAFASK